MLTHPKDKISLAFVAAFAAAHLWAMVLQNPPIFPFVFLFSALATMHFAIVHNHVHLPVFKSGGANRAFEFLLAILLVDAPTNVKILHVYNHHTHSETEQDVTATHLVPQRWRALILLVYPYFVAKRLRSEKQQMVKRFGKMHRQKQQELLVACIFLVFHFFLFDVKTTLLFWVVPSLVARWFLLLSNLVHHDGCDPHQRYQSARNFVSPVFNFFYFNTGYHMVHHLRPRVHWSELPELHEALVAPHIDSTLIERDVFSALFKFYILRHGV